MLTAIVFISIVGCLSIVAALLGLFLFLEFAPAEDVGESKEGS